MAKKTRNNDTQFGSRVFNFCRNQRPGWRGGYIFRREHLADPKDDGRALRCQRAHGE